MTLADIINQDTLVPIGVAVAIFIAIGSYTAWISKQFTSIGEKSTEQYNALKSELQEIKFRLDDRVTKQDIRRWERELFRANPELKAPEDGI